MMRKRTHLGSGALLLILTLLGTRVQAATEDYSAVVISTTPGKCEMHPMLLEKKTQQLKEGSQLDATDSVRCKGGGEAELQYRESKGKFKVKGDTWRVVGNPGQELQEDLTQQRQGRSAKYGPASSKTPS